MRIKQVIRKLVLGARASSPAYISYLRSLGMQIGDNTVIYAPNNCVIDQTRPWMVEIGRNVSITQGVTILTHGYDWSVFKGMYGDVLGSAGHVKIGDNVFIGMNATILKGVTIGNNVVIGANSLINKNVPDNCVVVGNPQRVVCGIDEYLEKRRTAQVDEAVDLYRCWRRNSPEGKRGGVPPKNIFSEFFWLFEPRGVTQFSDQSFDCTQRLRGTYSLSMKRFGETKPAFKSYEEFLAALEAKVALGKESNEIKSKRS